jgi:ribosomal protein L37AE/L43A
MIKLPKAHICPFCKHENVEVERVVRMATGVWLTCMGCSAVIMLGNIVNEKVVSNGQGQRP